MLRIFFILALCASAALAQDSQAAMQLYNKGVNLQEAGKGEAARQAFQTIIDKYPTSAYAKLAHEEMDKPLIARIIWNNLSPLSEKEVIKHFELANARLQVGRIYQADSAEQARTMLAQLILKKLKPKDPKPKNIEVTTKDLPDRKVEVTVTVVK